MFGLKERLIGAFVRLFSALAISKPAVQRIPVRNYVFLRRR